MNGLGDGRGVKVNRSFCEGGYRKGGDSKIFQYQQGEYRKVEDVIILREGVLTSVSTMIKTHR